MEKCKPQCELYSKGAGYNKQDCIHLHKMKHVNYLGKLLHEDRSIWKESYPHTYNLKVGGKVIHTSICYRDKDKKPGSRISKAQRA